MDDIDAILKRLKEKLEGNVEAALVFGSVARGEADNRSDVDLFVILKDTEPGGSAGVASLVSEVEKEFNRPVQTIISDKKFSKLEPQFLETILREHILIAGKVPEITISALQLEPYSIIKYDLSNLSHPEKKQVTGLLYGRKTEKRYKEKLYINTKRGIVNETNSLRIGIASILVPDKESKKIIDLLRIHGAKVRVINAWLSKI